MCIYLLHSLAGRSPSQAPIGDRPKGCPVGPTHAKCVVVGELWAARLAMGLSWQWVAVVTDS